MQNFIYFIAILDIFIFIAFFIGLNIVFYKLSKDPLNGSKERFFCIFSILCLNALLFALIYSNYNLFF